MEALAAQGKNLVSQSVHWIGYALNPNLKFEQNCSTIEK
jgi:hypothetical protein